MSDAVGSRSTTPSTNPPQTGGSAGADDQPAKPETTSYTIKKVNTGLLGKHVRENVEVDGESYGPGDSVDLTEAAYKSLRSMGVTFENEDKE
jgi:hypothetical protein